MKKAVFFNPYLDTLGGGERYFLTLASFLSQKNWQVDILWDDSTLTKKAKDRFGINLKGVNFTPNNLIKVNLLGKKKLLCQYDLSFFISDGSIPWLFAKENLLHFQVPFHSVKGRSFQNRLKFKKIDQIVCNSAFTKKFIDQEYKVKSLVVYPPVPIKDLKAGKKENLIFYLGRFTDLLHHKRQDVLVAAFKKMISQKKSGYRLVLAGSDQEGKALVESLKKQSQGFPIEIKTNLPFKQAQTLYSRAKIFWSASGFGIDEEKHPEQVEHFGITTVEAMAAGCVPLVLAKGGQKEIIDSGKNGFLWQNEEELLKLTQDLIQKPKKLASLSKAAVLKAQDFSEESFCQHYEKIIG